MAFYLLSGLVTIPEWGAWHWAATARPARWQRRRRGGPRCEIRPQETVGRRIFSIDPHLRLLLVPPRAKPRRAMSDGVKMAPRSCMAPLNVCIAGTTLRGQVARWSNPDGIDERHSAGVLYCVRRR